MFTLSVCPREKRPGSREGGSLRCDGDGRTDLRLVGEPEREPGDGERRLVDEGVVDALVAEEAREDAAVGCEAGERDPGVVGDAEHLPLVGGELGGGLVDGGEDGVGAGPEPHAGGALLDGLHGVLHLEEPPLGAPRGHVGVVLVAEHRRDSFARLLGSMCAPVSERASERRVWGMSGRFRWQRRARRPSSGFSSLFFFSKMEWWKKINKTLGSAWQWE
jgi:hypothetical protein